MTRGQRDEVGQRLGSAVEGISSTIANVGSGTISVPES